MCHRLLPRVWGGGFKWKGLFAMVILGCLLLSVLSDGGGGVFLLETVLLCGRWVTGVLFECKLASQGICLRCTGRILVCMMRGV